MTVKIEITDVWGIAELLKDHSTNLYMAEQQPESPITDQEKQDLKGELKRLAQLCATLKMDLSKAIVDAAIRTLPRTDREIDIIKVAVNQELKQRLLLFVPVERAKYYESESILSQLAKTQFPLASQEVRNAGNAFAMTLYTASVFHCMRALEHGIQALAQEVNITFDTQNWQNILDQIDKAVRDHERALPKGPAKNERMQFLSESVTDLRHFKDGWRNYVSHNKINYDEAQALKILGHSCSFIEGLSKQIQERK